MNPSSAADKMAITQMGKIKPTFLKYKYNNGIKKTRNPVSFFDQVCKVTSRWNFQTAIIILTMRDQQGGSDPWNKLDQILSRPADDKIKHHRK